MADNYLLMPVNWFKTQLKSYLMYYHDYPTENYIVPFLRELWKALVVIMEKIVFFGITSFLMLFCLTTIFPILNNYVKLGTSPLKITIMVLMLGLTVLVVKQVLEWKRRLSKWK